MTDFASLGLSAQLLSTLAAEGFDTPTPIQKNAIPPLLAGRDMIGLAQTGTGKTAAFGLPLIDRLVAEGRRPAPKEVRALILAPTRELVNQIAVNLRLYAKKLPLKVTTVVGGVSINRQTEEVGRGADILVATPGRLIDLANRRALNLSATRFLVLDEADQMLDLGFIHDLKRIVKMVPAKRQTMLFSATMPKAIAELAAAYLVEPVKVEVTTPGKTADKIDQFVHYVSGKDQKVTMLRDMLRANPDGRALVFGKTKHGSEKLAKHLIHCGFSVASIHGNKSQGQRDRALKGFRDGEIKILVATDVAARGIDVPEVTHVYNYDLPNVPEAYVHRIGRTARAGRDGIAIAFCTPDEIKLLADIEKLTGVPIPTGSGDRPEALDRAGSHRGKPQAKRNDQPQRGAKRAEGGRRGDAPRADKPRQDGNRAPARAPRPDAERSNRPASALGVPHAAMNSMYSDSPASGRADAGAGKARNHKQETRPDRDGAERPARPDQRRARPDHVAGDKARGSHGMRRNRNGQGAQRQQG